MAKPWVWASLVSAIGGCAPSVDHPPDWAGDGSGSGTGAGTSEASSPTDARLDDNAMPDWTAAVPSDASVHDSAVKDSAAAARSDGAASDVSVDGALPGWTLTWADEFDGPDGSAVDPTKWTHDVGGTGWGNEELEYYTAGTQNAAVQGGALVITATTAGASQFRCSGAPCQYTSARLKTEGLFAQQYGRLEARIQIPFGQGLWPAFWMLGSNIATAPWPACGEIDVMENIGKEPSINHGSLHAPGFPGQGLTGQFTLAGGASLSTAFHTYAVEWDASAIRFFVDDQLYETQTPANLPAGGTWAFDHPFFLLLNVAVGGMFPGNPDGGATFPQTMKVDWVRVYQRNGTEP